MTVGTPFRPEAVEAYRSGGVGDEPLAPARMPRWPMIVLAALVLLGAVGVLVIRLPVHTQTRVVATRQPAATAVVVAAVPGVVPRPGDRATTGGDRIRATVRDVVTVTDPRRAGELALPAGTALPAVLVEVETDPGQGHVAVQGAGVPIEVTTPAPSLLDRITGRSA